MSRRLKIPVSTIFDTLKEVEKHFHFTIVLRESEKGLPGRDPLTFNYGYQVSMDTGVREVEILDYVRQFDDSGK